MSRLYLSARNIQFWIALILVLLVVFISTIWDFGGRRVPAAYYRPFRFIVSRDSCPDNTEVALDDILSMKPPDFLSKYRNPCWKVEGNLRCLPYAMMIGVDKCGTTDIFKRITKHPDLLNNTGVRGKESLWWSWGRYGYGYYWFKDKPMESFERYLQYFDKATSLIEKSTNTDGYHPRIIVDGSVVDFWDFSGWPQIHQNKGLKEPDVLTPNLIKHVNPNTKFLLVLREPVERLYSDYFFWSSVREIADLNKDVFHKQVLKSMKVLEDCQSVNSLESCAFNRTLHLAGDVRIFVGLYAVYLKEWYKVFPREQFLIIRTEDYAKDQAETIKRIFKFLDIRPLSSVELDVITSGEPQYITESKLKAGPMLDSTKSLLQNIYSPYNKELTHILNDNSFLWKD